MEQVKNIQKLEAQILADYILQKYGTMSHLKLQKLIYYCDAYHLAYFDEELIPQSFEAWVHGPVCRDVFNNLKDFSVLHSDINSESEKINITEKISSEQLEIITDVLNELSKWTGLELESATHREQPWIDARKGYAPSDRCEVKISKETMRDFYKKEING